MEYKYEFSYADSKEFEGNEVYRIRALRAIPQWNVKVGDLGGFVLGGQNLSHHGDCWIANDAIVTKNGYVTDDAYIYGEAEINDDARVEGYAKVGENALVDGDSVVSGRAVVKGNARIDSSKIRADSKICGNAFISHSTVSENCYIAGNSGVLESTVTGIVEILDEAYADKSKINGTNITLKDNAKLIEVTIGRNKKTKHITIMDDARLTKCEMYGEDTIIGGNAVLEEGIEVYGNRIDIMDYAHLKGYIAIGNKVTIKDLASVINHDSPHPLQLNYATLQGDMVITDKNKALL